MEGTSGIRVKTTSCPAKPTEGTSGIGFHFQLEMSHLDMHSIGGCVKFIWNSPMLNFTHTHPDSSDVQCRSHIMQYPCGYYKLEVPVKVHCSYFNRSYCTMQWLQSTLSKPLQLLHLAVASGVLHSIDLCSKSEYM